MARAGIEPEKGMAAPLRDGPQHAPSVRCDVHQECEWRHGSPFDHRCPESFEYELFDTNAPHMEAMFSRSTADAARGSRARWAGGPLRAMFRSRQSRAIRRPTGRAMSRARQSQALRRPGRSGDVSLAAVTRAVQAGRFGRRLAHSSRTQRTRGPVRPMRSAPRSRRASGVAALTQPAPGARSR